MVQCMLKSCRWKHKTPRASLRAEDILAFPCGLAFPATAGLATLHFVGEDSSTRYFIHEDFFFFFLHRKEYSAGLNLLLPRETNHLIKKKWADRINAGQFQCGDMRRTTTTACKHQSNKNAMQCCGRVNQFPPKWAVHESDGEYYEGSERRRRRRRKLPVRTKNIKTWGVWTIFITIACSWYSNNLRGDMCADSLINNIKNG